MPNVSQASQFSNAQFTSSDLLKFVQENGSKVLWRTVSGLDSITKRKSWEGGKEIRYHLTVDPGGFAFGGLNASAGTFAHNDRAYGIQGFAVPKYQTMTMYFDKITAKLSDGEKKAFVSHMKLEYEQKTMFQKSFMNLQQLGDGTGRMATIIGLGALNKGADGTTDTTFTLANSTTLLKMKLSGLDTAIGAAAHLMEGMVISVMFPSYDDAVTGTANLFRIDSVPRFLTVGFKAAAGTYTNFFDAFRVVRVNQSSNEVLVAPARRAAPNSNNGAYAPYATWTADQHVQQGGSSSMWCDGTGVVTCTLFRGRANTLAAPSIVTAIQFYSVFAPLNLAGAAATTTPTAAFLVLPGYVPTGAQAWATGNVDFSSFTNSTYLNTSDDYDAARRMLGIGWDPNVDTLYSPTGIDVSLINPYMMTGIETLLYNETGTVHGIPRYQVQQYLPTKKDLNGQPMTFNSLFSGLVEHMVRNRDKDPNSSEVTQFNLLDMNPLVYSSFLSLSETDRRITDGKGIRGTSAKLIQVGSKTYELNMNSSQRMDRVVGLPKDSITAYGGEMEPVEADGQKAFLALNSSGRRTNAVESYFSVMGENTVENLRDTLYYRNFSISIL
jgi:hypothetical protein